MFNKLKSGAAKLGQDIKVAAGEAKEYTLNTIDKQRLVLVSFIYSPYNLETKKDLFF